MQLANHGFGKRGEGVLNDVVYTAEVVVGLDNVVDACGGCIGNDALSLEDVAGLFFGKAAALYVV